MRTHRWIGFVFAALAACGTCLAAITKEEKGGRGALVQGAAGPADLTRGKQAAAEGRVEDAKRDLEPLAKRGYFEAQFALGRLYANLEDQAHVDEAVFWLRKAAKKEFDMVAVSLGKALVKQGTPEALDEAEPILTEAWQRTKDPVALSGLIRMYADQPRRDPGKKMEELVAAAEKSPNPEPRAALIYWYRHTPQIGDHAKKLVEMCNRSLEIVPECFTILAQDARRRNDKEELKELAGKAATQYKRGYLPALTVAGVARAMVETPEDAEEKLSAAIPVSDLPEVDPADLAPIGNAPASPPPAKGSCDAEALPSSKVSAVESGTEPAAEAESEIANQLLEKLAKGKDDGPVMAAGVIVRYPYLYPGFELEPVLKAAAGKNNPLAVLYLGQLYLHGQRAMRDPKSAEKYLKIAAETTSTEVEGHYYLGRLYQYGYLNEVDAGKAIEHMLWSARRGYARADNQLARFFAYGKGICPDLVTAFVFASLGARDGTPAAAALKKQLEKALSPEQRRKARDLYEREYAIRPKLESDGSAQTASIGDQP
jgi:TPR repeat protein